MLNFRHVLLLLCAAHVRAAVFTSPVHIQQDPLIKRLEHYTPDEAEWPNEVLAKGERQGLTQFFFITGDNFHESANHEAPVRDNFWLCPYVIPATLGTPPQAFNLLLDLAWDTLFVPAAGCDGTCEAPRDHYFYQANESLTYDPVDEHASLAYSTDRFNGEMASDVFGLAGLSILNQTFVLAYEVQPLGFFSLYNAYDGVLGLAPKLDQRVVPGRRAVAPSPWSMMVNQSLLDTNLFAIESPSGVMRSDQPDRQGEISFGGINEKYDSAEFLHLPLSNYTDRAWAIEAQSLTWENETHPIHEDFLSRTLAGFDTTIWGIKLPGEWAERIYASFPQECGAFDCFIDCDVREDLPNLNFGIGGTTVTMTAFDYVTEVITQHEDGAEKRMCIVDFYPSKDQYPVDTIVLGRPFMETFYTVFDSDEREVRITRQIE